jgi:hypothetical protein
VNKRTIFILVAVVIAAWVCVLFWSHSQELHIVKLQRVMSHSTSADPKDCLVVAQAGNGPMVQGYAPSSECTSLQLGDVVRIENGEVQ